MMKIIRRATAVFFLSTCISNFALAALHGENSNVVANNTDYTEGFNGTNNQDYYDATSFNGTNLIREETDLKETSNNQQKELLDVDNVYRKEFNFRIVGGTEADAGEFPFMASWHRSFSSEPSCGGSLVSPNLVLTAAHCQGISGGVRIGSINAIDFYSGSPRGVEADVTREIPHPDYDDSTTAYDFMLLELDTDIDTDIYTPINLNFNPNKPRTGQPLTVIGFGTLESGGDQPDTLMEVRVPAVSYETCSCQYDDIIDDIHLCAGIPEGGKDSCQGDSGGPIFRKLNGVTTQVGIVSFGQGCALPDSSGVYARLSGVSSWLKTQICNRSSEPKPLYCEDVEPSPLPPAPTSAPEYQPTPDCVDSPGWYDGDGPEYDCEWYASNNGCEDGGGDCCRNDGKTANEACCVCGGGSGSNGSITLAPAETGTCEDSPRDWKDTDEDDCTWYAQKDDRCDIFGSYSNNDGKSANEVCCVCGGGVER